MERLSAILQGIWPGPSRSFSHATRDGKWTNTNMRQTASTADLRAQVSVPRSPLFSQRQPMERPRSTVGYPNGDNGPAGKHQPEMSQPEQAEPATRLTVPDTHQRRKSDSYTVGACYHEGDHRPQHEPKRFYSQAPSRPQFEVDQQYTDPDYHHQQQAALYYQEQYYSHQHDQFIQEQYIQDKHIQQQRAKQQQEEEAARTYVKRKPGNFLKNLFRTRPEAAPAQEFPKDPLPRNATKLDAICNYHLAQLDRIQQELIQLNHNIDSLRAIFQSVCEDENMDAYDGTRYLLEERVTNAIMSRNSLAKFVTFHLQEVERILVRKAELGFQNSIPNL